MLGLLAGLYWLVVFGWVVFVVARRVSVDRKPTEPLALLHAEAVLRRLLRRQLVWTGGVIAAASVTVLVLDHDVAVLFAPWLFSAVGQLFLQRRALALLERNGADAVRRGYFLVARARPTSVAVRASDRAFVAGKREAIPRSVAT
jgi:hypothetical protein